MYLLEGRLMLYKNLLTYSSLWLLVMMGCCVRDSGVVYQHFCLFPLMVMPEYCLAGLPCLLSYVPGLRFEMARWCLLHWLDLWVERKGSIWCISNIVGHFLKFSLWEKDITNNGFHHEFDGFQHCRKSGWVSTYFLESQNASQFSNGSPYACCQMFWRFFFDIHSIAPEYSAIWRYVQPFLSLLVLSREAYILLNSSMS